MKDYTAALIGIYFWLAFWYLNYQLLVSFGSKYNKFKEWKFSFLFINQIFSYPLSLFVSRFKRAQYTYVYIEPYEAVVHGTYGVETTSWTYLSSMMDNMFDFFSEMKHGGRSFSSPNYDGLVPI